MNLLKIYKDEIKAANRNINLISAASEKGMDIRHFADSLSCLKFLPPGPIRCVDVGSGAGLPGIPIKIKRPDIDMTLLESVRKKSNFLESVVKKLGFEGIHVICERAEIIGQDSKYRESYDVAVARAAGKFVTVLEYVLPLVKVGGCAIIFQGERSAIPDADTLAKALKLLGGKIADIEPYLLEEGGRERTLVRVEKVKPTRADYPRLPGVPKKKPLIKGR